ncbi:MAG: CBS domain-containing protein [Proteobacteria bacterium]|nr:CBS domain-containing protein [Pseudomonadota bacterium]MBU1740759.1 CBS domain-containing protein [Pseudomonadota bacterium]
MKSAPAGTGVLSGLLVKDAMSRHVSTLDRDAPIGRAIGRLIKHKLGALLIIDADRHAVGVVSKSDLVAAYYAHLPLDTPAWGVMFTEPMICGQDEPLDAALAVMRDAEIHRLYVTAQEGGPVVGVLAYTDVVGLLYRLCRHCERSRFDPPSGPGDDEALTVKEVMSPGVNASRDSDSLAEVMEGLSAGGLAAALIVGPDGRPRGVVSKTDLILAYRHGLPVSVPAGRVMSAPAQVCDLGEPLLAAVHRMIFPDVHRLFVRDPDRAEIVGVVSLSDVLRFRSGSCRACRSARIEIEPVA